MFTSNKVKLPSVCISQNYFPEMLQEDLPQELRGKHGAIFGNIEKIYEFHSQYFLGELQQFCDTPFHVGQIFLRYVSMAELMCVE